MRITCNVCRQPVLRVRKAYRRPLAAVLLGYACFLFAVAGFATAALGWTGDGLLAAEAASAAPAPRGLPLVVGVLSVLLAAAGAWLCARKRITECPRCDAVIKVD